MIQGCSNLIEHVVHNREEDLNSLKYLCKNSDDIHNFESVCEKVESYRNPLQGLESEYMQRKALEKTGCYIAPVMYSVGSSLLTTVQNQTNLPCIYRTCRLRVVNKHTKMQDGIRTC